jgi:hypothetical protein
MEESMEEKSNRAHGQCQQVEEKYEALTHAVKDVGVSE